MRILSIVFILVVLLVFPALAQDLPTENPDEVIVKGRTISHSWRDGRIWVPASEIEPLLNITAERRSVDLVEALNQKGGYTWEIVDGRFQAKRTSSGYVATNSAAAVSNNIRAKYKDRQIVDTNSSGASLAYQVVDVATESGEIQATITVINRGDGTSDPFELVCEFMDHEGNTYAVATEVMERLYAGRTITVKTATTKPSVGGAIEGSGPRNIAVSFLNVVQEPTYVKAATVKKPRGSGLDFNKGYSSVNRRSRPTKEVRSINQ
jgi:hypothetical protein